MAGKGKGVAAEMTKEQKKAMLFEQAAMEREAGVQKGVSIASDVSQAAAQLDKTSLKTKLDSAKVSKEKSDSLGKAYSRKLTKSGSKGTSTTQVADVSSEPAQSTHAESERQVDIDSEETVDEQEQVVVTEQRAPARQIKYRNRGKLPFKNLHNQIANLDTEISGLGRIAEMMTFLSNSRIGYAVSVAPNVYKQLIEDFWSTATVDIEGKAEFLCAKVQDVEVRFDEADLRKTLQLGDRAGDPTVVSKEKVRKSAMRCGYPEAKGEVKKKLFDPAFKYFCHILILCLSSRKAGTDTVNEKLMAIMASVMMNMRFNITRTIWGWMTDAAKNPAHDFLMFPRFVQLLLNDKYPQLKPSVETLLAVERIQDSTVLSMHDYRVDAKKGEQGKKPEDAKFWGAMVNMEYICPDGDAVDHGVDSDCELPVVDVEKPAPKQTKKRKAEEALADAVQTLNNEPFKQKRHPALVLRTGAAAKQGTASGASPNTQPDLTELLNEMKKLRDDLESVKAEAKAKEEKAKQEKESMEKKLTKLKEKHDKTRRELKVLNKKHERATEKMGVTKKGYYKLADKLKPEDQYEMPPDPAIEITDSESSGTEL